MVGLITKLKAIILVIVCSLLTGCEDKAWNNPYPFEDPRANTLYFAFTEHPHHLDPARSYSEGEYRFICQIYEPPLQYNYLKRPYTLEPLTASEMPEIQFFDAKDTKLQIDARAEDVAYTAYTIKIKPGIYYQPHPAFAKDKAGNYLYQNLTLAEASRYTVLSDFKEVGTKELQAEDYVYQIKRLADPKLASPVFGLMSNYIVGLTELRAQLLEAKESNDLRLFDLAGVEVIDHYTYRVKIKGKYPQFRFWLTMPFFAPVPWEVAKFYAQPGLEKHNISLDWYPVGTGPYELIENNPDRRMTLQLNPNFRGELFPTLATANIAKTVNGTEADEAAANDQSFSNNAEAVFLAAAGSKIPSVAKAVFTLEKESIPYWNKFLQGFYDMSGISSDNFGTAVQLSAAGSPEISTQLSDKKIRLQTSVTPELFYWGFNMLDETVGGMSPRSLALRHAIAKGFDVQYFIDIFMNGRGVLANGPVPPDIFGYQPETTNLPKGQQLMDAKKILKDAGIIEGQVIYLDAIVSEGPDEIALHSWLTEQFRKLGLRLIIRGTDLNRFQEKLQQGTVQIFFYGWNADYPDPENFLFLFYGPNGAAKQQGVNYTNYSNPEYDKAFEKMRSMPDNEERLRLIRRMQEILNRDQPAIWGFYPKSYALYHQWMRIGKPSGIVQNTLKYAKINPDIRADLRLYWNQPKIWPLWILILFFLLSMFAAWRHMINQEQRRQGRL